MTISEITQRSAPDYAEQFSALKKEFPQNSKWYSTFDGSSQCAGWARLAFFRIHGYEFWVNNPGGNTVIKITDPNYIYTGLKVGDLVRYRNNGHSVIIMALHGDTVEVCDCNSDYACTVKYGTIMTRDHLAATFTHAYTMA